MARKTRKAAAVAAERGRLRFLKRRAQEISTPPTETPKLSSKEVEFLGRHLYQPGLVLG